MKYFTIICSKRICNTMFSTEKEKLAAESSLKTINYCARKAGFGFGAIERARKRKFSLFRH